VSRLAPVEAGVSLEALLESREQRAMRQAQWLENYQQAVISLTLVTPGSVKDSERYRRSMAVAVEQCHSLLAHRHWPVLQHELFWLPSGPEAMWCVDHTAVELKATLVDLEQTHPLGRLWDFDVFDPQVGQVGRRSLDIHRRLCLLCDEPAHVCARSRRHPLDEVVARVEVLIDGWFAAN
jgi:holo-ACP synthase